MVVSLCPSWKVSMKRVFLLLSGLLLLAACRSNAPAEQQPGYIVQVSLGGWNSPDYTADRIVSRIDSVSSLINVEKVIIEILPAEETAEDAEEEKD